MATLANQGMASQAAFGQLGSSFVDNGGTYTPPSGKVVVAITCLSDTIFTALVPEATGDCFSRSNAGAGSGGVVTDSLNVFPKGITIYGSWTSVAASADAAGGIVMYLGPSK